ncbi:MAG: hypothetical protein AB2A00_43125 [Myxococcota bacterium]
MRNDHLKLCLVDMNNGVANEATRCFRRISDAFQARVRAANPRLETSLKHVQPRNLGELPGEDMDLVLSSGGPGSPYDGYEDPWCTGYRKFVDSVIERSLQRAATAPGLLVVCHSFEIVVSHLQVAKLQPRDKRKFGVMPAYMTPEGMRSPLLSPFGDRLFAFEHRNWEAVDLDEKRLRELGGQLLARESRDGVSKGRGLMAFKFAPGVEGTQFHPEADRAGVVAWINKPDMAAAFKDAYGDYTYEQMIDTLADPTRLARTFALLIPGWLTREFNRLAAARGWQPLGPPVQDMTEFQKEFPAAV